MNNDRVADLLAQLAHQLGTTVEHLYQIVLAARPTVGFVALMNVVISVLILLVGVKLIRIGYSTSENFTDNELNMGSFFIMLCGLLGGCVCVLAGFLYGQDRLIDAIYAFSSPEYSAIHDIMNWIKEK